MKATVFITLLSSIAVASEDGGDKVAAYPFDAACLVNGVKRVVDNQSTPDTLNQMRSQYKDAYIEMPPEKSILHNFRKELEPILQTPEGRVTASIMALYEYHQLPEEQWQVLDPAMPNVKFVENGGKREVVYDRFSGRKIDRGPNQGTANDAAQDSPGHFSDIIWYELCGTPDDTQHMLGALISMIRNEVVKKELLDKVQGKVLDGANREDLIKQIAEDAIKAINREHREEKKRRKDERRAAKKRERRIQEERNGTRVVSEADNDDDELSPDQIPDPDNDNYVWCEDVCGEEGLRPVCPADTSHCIYWGCSRCGHVIRKKARKAKRQERIWKAQGIEGMWHGSQFDVRQAKAAE